MTHRSVFPVPRTHFPLFDPSSVGSDRYDSHTSRVVERCFTIAPHASGCESEQDAARMLGFTQVTWDDYTGEERQPASLKKFWHMLTAGEKAGALVLGYTRKIWDDRSSEEMRPASHTTHWAELTTCGKQPSYCPLRVRPVMRVTEMTVTHLTHLPTSSGCKSEQDAAKALRFTQVVWDNESGNETQPSSSSTAWDDLAHEQRMAAVVLGYTAKSWDNESGNEKQPASEDKFFAELTTCGEDTLTHTW